jgi:hypothetical protein
MIYAAEKKRLFHELIMRGTKEEAFDALAKEIGITIPGAMLTRWKKRFYSVLPVKYNSDPLLVNRFCVGADPEFVFMKKAHVDSYGERQPAEYMHAENLGLTTLQAFGADMSGRQAELRAYPSRSVLEVVASMMDELRWLNESKNLDKYEWIAPATHQRDGVGGHIHIGRKRPHSESVIASLDGLTRMLVASKMFDSKGQEARVANTGYGRYGDFRCQTHGFEYRTMPSWLCSPWCAYLTLVLAKLAVLENFVEMNTPKGKPELIILNLLRAYQGVDDDARIALAAMEQHGMPVFHKEDIKKAWGVPPSTKSKSKFNSYFPPVIAPSETSVQELFQHLTSDMQPIPARLPNPTWEPFLLPENIDAVGAQTHMYGTTDVAMGLVASVHSNIQRGNKNEIHVITYGHKLDTEAMTKYCLKYPSLKGLSRRYSSRSAEGGQPQIIIYVPTDTYNQNTHAVNGELVSELREFLADSGLFPIARYREYKKLLQPMVVVEKKKPEGVIGKVVFATA